MKQRYLLLLLLLTPFLAHADALSALGEAQAWFALVMFGIVILVGTAFLIVMYSWPQWGGVPYVLGIPLLLLTWMRFTTPYPEKSLTLVLLLFLLLNGLVWARGFRPMPVRLVGIAAIAVAMMGATVMLNS